MAIAILIFLIAIIVEAIETADRNAESRHRRLERELERLSEENRKRKSPRIVRRRTAQDVNGNILSEELLEVDE